jgi:hypothetical protein
MAFREQVSGMIGSVCAKEFVAMMSFVGCLAVRLWGFGRGWIVHVLKKAEVRL